MVASLYLLGCVLAVAQAPSPTGGGDWTVETRLNRSQELVYRGTFTETTLGARVQTERAFRLETRIFILDTPVKGYDAALMTVIKPRDARPGQPVGPTEAPIYSVRLERALLSPQGKLTPEGGATFGVPLDSVPLLETGAFVEVPKGRLGVEQTWQVAEENRPPHSWRITGTELANGSSCMKLVGVQQSEDWERPTGEGMAWRRTDTLWLAPRVGYAYRVERVIERREPGRQEANLKSVLRYELESSLQYPGNHADDRRQEITQALALRDASLPLLQNPLKSSDALAALGNRLNYFLENQTATPYREAIFQMKRRLEAGKKGELTVAAPETTTHSIPNAEIGQLAPDFLALDVTTSKSAQLRKWQGRPVLLVFYHPASTTCSDVLGFAEKLAATYPQGVSVLAMAMSDDADAVRKQREELKMTLATLTGTGLRISFNVEATPKFVLLDDREIMRGQWTGWGPQTPREVLEELNRWLPKK